MSDLHRIRIEVPRGRAIFGRITLDGEPLRGVTRIAFDTGETTTGFVSVTVTLMPEDLVVEGDVHELHRVFVPVDIEGTAP
jgi:hypothetical protein